jgi:hypothetical protein
MYPSFYGTPVHYLPPTLPQPPPFSLSQAVAYDIADEFLMLADVAAKEEGNLAVVLSGEQSGAEDIVLARLADYAPQPASTYPNSGGRAKRRVLGAAEIINITVMEAKGLEKLGAFGTR